MKAIVLAAGYGTRMLPITKTIPKELLPVGNKPVIQYIMEGLTQAGIEDIIVITSQSKKALEDYFDKNYELEEILRKKNKLELLDSINKPKYMANYFFVKQREQKGTGHAVLQAKPLIDDDFLVVFGDAIYPPDMFIQMKNHFDTHKSPLLTLHEVPQEEVHKYGVVALAGDKITNIVEKPAIDSAPSNLIWNGACILPPEILSIIPQITANEKSGEVYLPDAIKVLMEQRDVLSLQVSPFWDIGNPDLRLEANVHIANHGSLF